LAHVAVLLAEVLEYLAVDPEGVYVDCTLGAGGYAEAIAQRLTTGKLIAIDRDAGALEAARPRLAPFGERVRLAHASFSRLEEVVGKGAKVQGLVADVGLSRDQIEDPRRGFSFQREGPLDMRMDQRSDLTAGDIVNHYGEKQLADLIYQFGEERRSRRIARAIVRGRPFQTTTALAETIARAVPRTKRERIHPATRTFQALRIAVNREVEELRNLLACAPSVLSPGGRMVVVSFHSLEDREVKLAFRRWEREGVLRRLTRRIVRPPAAEVERNPASRSAKLRASERTDKEWVN